MKKTIYLTFIFILGTIYTNLPQKKPIPMLKGSIVSNQLNTIPQFKVYFQGIQTLSNEDGFFSLPLEKNIQEHSILLCKDFNPVFSGTNTIENLKINPNKPYRFFSCKKATIKSLQEKIISLEQQAKPINMRLRLIERQIERQKKYISFLQNQNKSSETKYKITPYRKKLLSLQQRKKGNNSIITQLNKEINLFKEKYNALQNETTQKPAGDFWLITEKELETKDFVIPNNCVTICLNPKIVSTIENWTFALPKNFITIPRIVLKNNLETKNIRKKQSVTRSSLKSNLYSLEQKTFHETKKEEYKDFKNKPELRVSLTR